MVSSIVGKNISYRPCYRLYVVYQPFYHYLAKPSMPCPAPHPASQPQIFCCAKEQFKDAVKAYGVRGLASKLGITPAYVSMVAGGREP